MKLRPLNQDLANPCMKCGSVQCSYCGIDVASAVAWLKKEIRQDWKCYSIQERQVIIKRIDEAFAGVERK